MTESIECVVIGAGAVGLACARALAMAGREVVVLEAAAEIGTGTSSRNSEVIHAGLYYTKDSLKARLCVTGREMLYAYCRDHGVGHNRLGKLIVATEPDQIPALRSIEAHARANGVADIAWIDGAEAMRMEPALNAVAALHSPSTGIIDSHGYMLALQGDAEAHGVGLAFVSPVTGGKLLAEGGALLQIGGAEPMDLKARWVINSAGLGAQAIAASLDGLPAATIPEGAMAKGSYFTLSGRSPFSRLIYPLPGFTGLGVHLTLDLAGQARFGPDAEMVTVEDYAVDPRRAPLFYEAIRRYWPGLGDGLLHPDYAGIRPVLNGVGGPKVDFVIQGPRDHGAKGLINLYGIESPGLTASLAIAEEAAALLR
jgi:L-2-hydroxyglutarate oxidase LhgO